MFILLKIKSVICSITDYPFTIELSRMFFTRNLLMMSFLLSLFSTSFPQSTVWVNAEKLTVEGRGWTTGITSFYDRLPAKAEKMVPAKVWELSHLSAGILVRFKTASPEINVRWKLLNEMLSMPHMPATGVSGVDLYILKNKEWKFIGNGRATANTNTAVFFPVLRGTGIEEYMLYLPLYNGVSSVEIGTKDSTPVFPSDEKRNGPVVFYGTSITQGGCASRPGNAAVAILGRKLNKQVINLGFSGTGKMEKEMAELLTEIPASAYIIDCLPNMTEDGVKERAEQFLRVLTAGNKTIPVLICEEGNLYGLPMTPKAAALREITAKLKAEGITNIDFIEMRSPYGNDSEGTVDGVHPNDLGFMRQAEQLLPHIRKKLPKGN